MNEVQHPESDIYVVGIGASAGGLDALEKLFENASVDTGLAFVVIQHLSPDYKSLMADLLSKRTMMQIQVAADGMMVEPNHVYLIPPKKNMTIFHRKLYLTERESEQLHLPIDIFFQSLAEDLGEKAIGVILSGTGSDGTRGIRAIKEKGGMVMTQDEKSARFDGMPRSAIATNLVDYILPPEHMVREMLNYIQHPCLASGPQAKRAVDDGDTLSKIFALLRSHSGVDFTYYKQSTMIRRIERRMGIKQIDRLGDYLHYLYQSPTEVTVLYRELLIGVTRFFRDPEAFELLRKHAISEIFEGKRRDDPIRVWVAGCSTGEEAYSLAILLMEYMEEVGRYYNVKVFATDLDKSALEYAGKGVYPESIAADISPEYLRRHLIKSGDSYAVRRRVREMVIFAQQNLITDPPFSKVDLISCRNVLIYLQPILQKQVIAAFQFALNPDGFLFLGTSETVGEAGASFICLDNKWKLYQYKGGRRPSLRDTRMMHLNRDGQTLLGPQYTLLRTGGERRATENVYRGLIEAFLPPSIVVDETSELVYAFGDLDPYLRAPTGGVFTPDVLNMAREGLSIPLSTAIHKVFKDHEAVTYSNISLGVEHPIGSIDLIAKPFVEPGTRQRLALIQFNVVDHSEREVAETKTFDLDSNAQQRIQDLEQELQYTRESLQATVEELETSNEELQATNEELLAANEELQSTNEELQSVNEELITVNAEYHTKIQELTDLNADMDNLLSSTDVGTIFLDRDLRIRRFTPAAQQEIHLLEQDIGRPIGHISHTIVNCDLVFEAQQVLKTLNQRESEVQNNQGRWYQLNVLPYYTLDKQVGGIVMTLVDITALKAANLRLSKLSAAIEHSVQLILILDVDGNIEYLNPRVIEATGYQKDRFVGQAWDVILAADVDTDQSRAARYAVQMGQVWDGELLYRRLDADPFWCLVSISPIRDDSGNLIGALCAAEDITVRKMAEEALRQERDLVAGLMETSPVSITMVDRQGQIVFANPQAEQTLGLSKDQITQRAYNSPAWHITDYEGNALPDDELPFSLVLKTGKPVHNARHAIEWPDGSRVSLSIHGAPLEDESGEIAGVVFALEDVTSILETESALRQERDFIATVLDTTAALVVVLDPVGRIVRFNAACEALTGYTFEEVQGRPFIDLFIASEELDGVSQTFDNLLAGNYPSTYANYLQTRGGDKIWIAWSNTVFTGPSGEPEYIISTGIDLTNSELAP